MKYSVHLDLRTPVFTKGKKEDTGNYRLVSFVSIPGKVMEQPILEVISKCVDLSLLKFLMQI